MLIAHRKSFLIAVLISLLFLSVGLAGIDAVPQLELGLFVLIMLTTGIPHGATDHLIYSKLQQAQGKKPKWNTFLISYLVTMAAYSLCWWLLPGPSLIVFLLISAYHFGQSQFLYIRWRNSSTKKRLLNLSWGAFILTGLLLMHLTEVLILLSSIIPVPLFLDNLTNTGLATMIAIPLACTLLLWGIALYENAISLKELLREIIVIALLFAVSYTAGLWLGFGLYFGVWHACSSIKAEVSQFRKERSYSWTTFFRDALPFSLISMTGIGILGTAGWWFSEHIPLILLFFIAISVLTLPHTIFMDRFYGIKEAN